MRILTVSGSLLLASGASAQVTDLTVDAGQSSLSVEVSAVGVSDSDSTPLSGTVSLELDSYAAPTGVSVDDFALNATNSLSFNFSLGFLGSASLTISGISASYAAAMPTAVAPVDGGGAFTIVGVPIALTGSGTASASGLFSALDGTTVNLADFGTFSGDLGGTVQVVGSDVNLSVVLSGTGEQVVSGITITSTADLTLVASGPVPMVACPGDIADDFGLLGADGMVSFGDFLALLGLVGPCPGGTPGCTGDIADDFGLPGGDGMVSFGDFLALLGLVGPCP